MVELVRSLLVTGVLVALAGCFTSDKLAEGSAGDDGRGSGGAPFQCSVDNDCALAGPTCCECPTFAVPIDDPLHASCDNVMCPAMTCPNNVAASCNEGECKLTCLPMACPTSCQVGFTIDSTGCLACDCATASTACMLDTDCVDVRADCCGCAKGGGDTSVPASEASAHDAALDCPTEPVCPGTNVCELGAEPHCIEGTCALFAGTLPPNACGRADLPACPASQICTVNANASASLEGVGVCLPMP
jgi:hypothetical protein